MKRMRHTDNETWHSSDILVLLKEPFLWYWILRAKPVRDKQLYLLGNAIRKLVQSVPKIEMLNDGVK